MLPPPLSGAAFCDSEDYEIRVLFDFENRLIRPLSVASGADTGVDKHSVLQVLLFARDRCRPDCSSDSCSNCRARKLYQDFALDPKGAVTFNPHKEYLYCLRVDRQPVKALLSLRPREQDVEVKELGLLAYWFTTWFQRAKDDKRITAVSSDSDDCVQQTPSAIVATAAAVAATNGGILGRGSPDNLNLSSKYLPNLRIIYKVKRDIMIVTLPEPAKLTHEIEVILMKRGGSHDSEGDAASQVVNLKPGMTEVNEELMIERDTPYTLMLKLKEKGKPVKLLELYTEQKVLRVQESMAAPKHMNFLMERCMDQRRTFILHITFDEQPIQVAEKCLGEFFLDVDVDKRLLVIGTVQGNESRLFRVEKLLEAPDNEGPLSSRKSLIYEGCVDPATMFIRDPISIERLTDYLITVIDPQTGTEMPTSVLSVRKNSLFVKEVKGSEVKLHVTVQRDFLQSLSNVNNSPDATGETQVETLRRSQPEGAFHCPVNDGYSRYRILHSRHTAASSGHHRRRSSSSRAPKKAETEAAIVTSDAIYYSSGCEDSGFGRNPSSLSESLDAAATLSRQRLLRVQERERERERQQERERQRERESLDQQRKKPLDYNFNLNVDLPSLQACLLPNDAGSGYAGFGSGSGCYLIVEDSLTDSRSRSVPCQLGQSFAVRHWCRYTVKAIGDTQVTPLFNFSLTDTEVRDIRPCNPNVRLS